jgi:hypothetical protein
MSEVYKLTNTTNDCRKSQFGKENPIFTKKKVLFSTSRIPLADGASCVTFSATRVSPHPPPSPSWQKSHLLAPYRCVKFEREKKLYFFLVKEIVFDSSAKSFVSCNTVYVALFWPSKEKIKLR